jgi:hypothetical protein
MGSSTEALDARARRVEFDPATEDRRVSDVVEELCRANESIYRRHGRVALPSREVVATLIDGLRAVLYPIHFGSADAIGRSLSHRIGTRLDKARRALEDQVRRGLEFTCEHVPSRSPCALCARRSVEVTDALVGRLPAIRRMLDPMYRPRSTATRRSPRSTKHCFAIPAFARRCSIASRMSCTPCACR